VGWTVSRKMVREDDVLQDWTHKEGGSQIEETSTIVSELVPGQGTVSQGDSRTVSTTTQN